MLISCLHLFQPNELGRLSNLQELYVDSNDLEALPEAVTRCRALQQLDVCDNKLMVLPDDLGELDQLTDLVLSQNCIQILPHSIGQCCSFVLLGDRRSKTKTSSVENNVY